MNCNLKQRYARVPAQIIIGRTLMEALFIVPVIVVYFEGRGVNLGEFLIIQGLFRAAAIVLEVPTGYISDRLSRRQILLVAGCFSVAGVGGMIVAYGFWQLLAAEMVLAVASAFFSGTAVALLYDALAVLGRKHEGAWYVGRMRMYTQLSVGASMLLGGVLYQLHPTLPLFGTLMTYALALVVFWHIHEPPRRKRESHNVLADFVAVVRYATHGHAELRLLMVYPAILLGVTIVPFWAAQRLMTDYGVPESWFGVLLCINFLLSSWVSGKAHVIVQAAGLRRVTWALLPIVVAGLLILGLVAHPIAIVGLYTAAIGWNLGSVVFVDLVNRLIDDDHEDGDAADIRATVLSVFHLMQLLYGMLALMLIGWLEVGHGLNTLLIWLAVVVVGICLLPLRHLLKQQRFKRR